MIAHQIAPDAGRNVRCTCGAEYSLTSNLMRHISSEGWSASVPLNAHSHRGAPCCIIGCPGGA